MAIAYLITTCLNYDEALAVVETKRPFIRMIEAQKEPLHKFAAFLAQRAEAGAGENEP